jgi:hypothetical protein
MNVACSNDDFRTALLSSGRNKLVEDELTNAVCLRHCVNQSATAAVEACSPESIRTN